MTVYAKDTTVPVERSKSEIERTLTRYGADQFASGWTHGVAVIAFRAKDRHVKFELPLPAMSDDAFSKTPKGRLRRSADLRQAAYEQECRSRWRALALAIKAKLEAVEAGITTFEQEFLAHIVIPGAKGNTVGQWLGPQLDQAYTSGKMPKSLPMFAESER